MVGGFFASKNKRKGQGHFFCRFAAQGVKQKLRFRPEPVSFKRSGLKRATTLSESAIFVAAAFQAKKVPLSRLV